MIGIDGVYSMNGYYINRIYFIHYMLDTTWLLFKIPYWKKQRLAGKCYSRIIHVEVSMVAYPNQVEYVGHYSKHLGFNV